MAATDDEARSVAAFFRTFLKWVHSDAGQPTVATATLKAGLPRVRFHQLRHFYASALIRAGESVKTVQVGNAVRAGCGEFLLLRLDWTPRRLHIEVHDDAPGQPQVRLAEPKTESGRGMWIVRQLAVRWGVISKRPGRIVWAEIALPRI